MVVNDPNASGRIVLAMQTKHKVDPGFPKHLQLMNDHLQVVVSEWTTSDRFDFNGLEEGNYMVKVSSSYGSDTSGVIGVARGSDVDRTMIVSSPKKKKNVQLSSGASSVEPQTRAMDEKEFLSEQQIIRILKRKPESRESNPDSSDGDGKRLSMSFVTAESWSTKMRPSGASLRKKDVEPVKRNYARLELWSFDRGGWERSSYKRINLDQLKTGQRLLEYDSSGHPRMLVATSDFFAKKTVMCPLYDSFDLNLDWQEVSDPFAHPLTMTMTIENPEADALLTLLNGGSFNDAKSFMESPIAEHLLWGKVDDPLGAAVGGYYLLLARDLDRLHDWANNLANMFEWLPDGAIIHAWQMITKGRTDENGVSVRSRLLQAFERGVPLCTQGLKLLFEGLDQLSSITQGEDAEVETALNKLRGYVQRTDWSQKMTTFSGAFPSLDGKWPLLENNYYDLSNRLPNEI